MVRAAALIGLLMLTGCSSATGDIAAYALLGDAWVQHKNQEFLATCAPSLGLAACQKILLESRGVPSVYGALSRPVLASPAEPGPTPGGIPVYSTSQCIGAIVNGECHGSIMPDAAYHPTCYGQMLNGQCTGPLF